MLVKREKLLQIAKSALIHVGESEENAGIVAESMVKADMRGVTTHGTYLIDGIKKRKEGNQITLPTVVSVVSDSGATAVLDGNDGIGMVAAHKAADLAVEKAKAFGIGIVLIRNTNNVGTLSTYTQKVTDRGMIAFLCGNAAPSVAPWGSSEAMIGTNPLSIGFPIPGGIFNSDMATTVVARGKIRKALRNGEKIPDNWASDEEGKPTTDPAEAMKGTLFPIGGAKGSAIALSIDLLSGLLSGSSYAKDVKSFHVLEGKTGVGAAIIVIDPQRFMGAEEYDRKIGEYVQKIKEAKRAPGFDRILMPGEIEAEKEKKSAESGIEIDDAQLERLSEICGD